MSVYDEMVIAYAMEDDRDAAVELWQYFKEMGHDVSVVRLNPTNQVGAVGPGYQPQLNPFNYVLLIGGEGANSLVRWFVDNGYMRAITDADRGYGCVTYSKYSKDGKRYSVIRGYEKEDTKSLVEYIRNNYWDYGNFFYPALYEVRVKTVENVYPQAVMTTIKASKNTNDVLGVGDSVRFDWTLKNYRYTGQVVSMVFVTKKTDSGDWAWEKVYYQNKRLTNGESWALSYTHTMKSNDSPHFYIIYGHHDLVEKNGEWVWDFVKDDEYRLDYKSPSVTTTTTTATTGTTVGTTAGGDIGGSGDIGGEDIGSGNVENIGGVELVMPELDESGNVIGDLGPMLPDETTGITGLVTSVDVFNDLSPMKKALVVGVPLSIVGVGALIMVKKRKK